MKKKNVKKLGRHFQKKLCCSWLLGHQASSSKQNNTKPFLANCFWSLTPIILQSLYTISYNYIVGNKFLFKLRCQRCILGTSLVVQWLRFRASTARGADAIPGEGTKDPTCHVVQPKEEKRNAFYSLTAVGLGLPLHLSLLPSEV